MLMLNYHQQKDKSMSLFFFFFLCCILTAAASIIWCVNLSPSFSVATVAYIWALVGDFHIMFFNEASLGKSHAISLQKCQ